PRLRCSPRILLISGFFMVMGSVVFRNDSLKLSTLSHTMIYAKAQFIACGVKHSGSWLNTVPSSPELFLMDAHFARQRGMICSFVRLLPLFVQLEALSLLSPN